MHPSASFADRIVNIAVTGTVARIELGTLALPTSEGAAPTLTPSQTLVMPLDGFLASFGMLESVVKKMIADGVVKAKPQSEPAIAAKPAPLTRQ
jgi:hypothetical protein